VCVGEIETKKERLLDMLANDSTKKSSSGSESRMMDGEEPTEVLLALVSSPLLALQKKGLAKVLTAKGANGQSVVLAVFNNSEWDANSGIVLEKSVGNALKP
jgi:hypothetical protein